LWSCCWQLLQLLLARLTQQLAQAQGPAQGLLLVGLVVLVALCCIAAVLACAGGLSWPAGKSQGD
jgi:hypothetical protein